MRVFAIVLDDSKKEPDKFEILETKFIPEPNTIIILKNGDEMRKTVVLKTENVLTRIGSSADLTFNVFMRVLPLSEEVN